MSKTALKNRFKIQDDYRTPKILVECIKPYLDIFLENKNKKSYTDLTVYCPCDTDNSEFVRYFKSLGCKVYNGDYKEGQNFFETEIPSDIDLIITNPPFSLKKEFITRLVKLDKPFCLLLTMIAINYQDVANLLYEIEQKTGEAIQFIIPDKKVSFDGKTVMFSCGYWTYKFTNKTHFLHLPHNNTKDNFTGAYSLSCEPIIAYMDYDFEVNEVI